MKPRLRDLLYCPSCYHHPLELESFETVPLELTPEQEQRRLELGFGVEKYCCAIKTGLLLCNSCKTWYPIKNFVPVMWKFHMPLHDKFARAHHKDSEAFSTHKPPSGQAEPGERQTLLNYSVTWETLGKNDLNFYHDHAKIQAIFRACLRWPAWALKRKNLSVLDVGTGFGSEAANLHQIFQGETIGIDLNVSVVTGGHLNYKDPFLHYVVCSLFEIPLLRRSFDAVISMGVLHHTYSTPAAIHSIVRYMKDDGFILIWLYGKEELLDSMRDLLIYLWRERFARPIVSRLPVWLQHPIINIIAALRYPWEKRRVPNPGKWRFKNTVHHTRDLYTPVYAYRHRHYEPIMWLDQVDVEARPVDFVQFKNDMGFWNNGVTVCGVKRTGLKDADNPDYGQPKQAPVPAGERRLSLIVDETRDQAGGQKRLAANDSQR